MVTIALKAYALGSVLTVQEGNGLWQTVMDVHRTDSMTAEQN